MKNQLFYLLIFAGIIGCKQSAEKTDVSAGNGKDRPINCAPPTTDKAWFTKGTKAPKLKGLEGINFKISTTNVEAQEYFNQGMMLSYGFNHAEAARSFFEVSRLDSSCAMAYWGFAYVLGPNYNAGMEDDNYQRAYQAAQKAMSLAGSSTKKEQDLIHALSLRYVPQPPADRSSLDSAYSKAMKKVYETYPTDPDITALYAESLMDMHPWDMYDKKTKEPRPWATEIVAMLEQSMQKYPNHPGPAHFYIHAVEASKTPERGLASANLLMSLVPGSGHLVHMPSHIYIWTGDYHRGTLANQKAVESDSAYITACHAQGAYPLAYYPHNYHYLAATAALEGNSTLAIEAAKKVQEHTAEGVMTQPGWGTLQHYYTIPYYIAVKFGKWDDILKIKEPAKELIYPRAVLHYAKGMAYLGKSDNSKAEEEYRNLLELSKDTVLKEITIWDINTTQEIIQIAVNVLGAEIYRSKKDYPNAIGLFQKAIAIEDNLNYDEPPDWFFSVRHHLGTALLQAGKFAEAEKNYQDDLNIWKENGWALIGLYQAQQKLGKQQEALEVKKRFDKAWKYADFEVKGSFPL